MTETWTYRGNGNPDWKGHLFAFQEDHEKEHEVGNEKILFCTHCNFIVKGIIAEVKPDLTSVTITTPIEHKCPGPDSQDVLKDSKELVAC